MKVAFLTGLLMAFFYWAGSAATAETVRIATYNLENYLDQPVQGRSSKSSEAKGKIRENIRALRPDVVAVQEIGSLAALEELQSSLGDEGLKLPYRQFVTGRDTNIYVGILSRLPFTAERPHTNETFLYRGRRYRTSRGFGEVKIQLTNGYTFTLFAAHLKSRRPAAEADESELRVNEARLLRELIDARLAEDPQANIIVVGDLNETRNAPAVRVLIGRGKTRLTDVRPTELNGRQRAGEASDREVSWSHYFATEDTYSRIDYILVSQGMARELDRNETYVLDVPDWGLASDHRPLLSTFRAADE